MDDRASATGPGLLDGLALLAEVADELVVRTVRDTHLAGSRRAYAAVQRRTSGAAALPRLVDHGITSGVYAGVGVGLRAAALGLGLVAATGRGPRLDESRPGRFLSRSVIGLIGDRLALGAAEPRLADVVAPWRRRRGGGPGVTGGCLPLGGARSRRLPPGPVRGRDRLGPARATGTGRRTRKRWRRPAGVP